MSERVRNTLEINGLTFSRQYQGLIFDENEKLIKRIEIPLDVFETGDLRRFYSDIIRPNNCDNTVHVINSNFFKFRSKKFYAVNFILH
jgi:hypothetical protein|nr:MAG TPA: hypothetical protein [Caudoviricetes sp.]